MNFRIIVMISVMIWMSAMLSLSACIYSSTPPDSSSDNSGGGVQSGSLPSNNQFTQSVGSTDVITSGSLRATLTINPMAVQGLRTTSSLSFSDPGLERTVRQLTASESSLP